MTDGNKTENVTMYPNRNYEPSALLAKGLCLTHLIDLSLPRSGELRMQKLNSHLVRTQSLNILPLKPGVGQYITIHATLTARDFFLA